MRTLKKADLEVEAYLKPLLVELERVAIRLRYAALRLRSHDQRHQDTPGNLIVSEDEVDDILSDSLLTTAKGTDDFDSFPLEDRLSQFEIENTRKGTPYICCGTSSRLEQFVDAFGLNQFEREIILLGLLPEVALRYQKLFAYLNDDISRKIPTIDMALQCFQNTFNEKTNSRRAFLSGSSLMTNYLIQLEEDSPANYRPLLARGFKVDDRVVNYLLGSDNIDTHLSNYVKRIDPTVMLEELVLNKEQKDTLKQLSNQLTRQSHTLIYLEGPQGIGKKTIAQALCKALTLSLLVVDVESLLTADGSPEYLVDLVFREARLQDSATLWDNYDCLLADERSNKILRRRILHQANIHSGPVFAAGTSKWQQGNVPVAMRFLRVPLELPSHATRRRLWQVYLNRHDSDISGTELDEITDKFCLTPGQTREAVMQARGLETCREETTLSLQNLYAACRAASNHRLGNLMKIIQTGFTLEDIILPRDQMAQLREIIGYARFRHTVYEDWNFNHKSTQGKGLNALFTGPSGTGKTMAASIIANGLGLDMYRTDLSSIVSKYIGETEKNLDRMFSEAQNSNSILFFDEADALFGKRSEVRDSHDRYANIETAYLLQKMEEYDGIAILATNLGKNLDDAFKRRLQFSIEFPMPEEADRYRIWQHVFPEEAPLATDVDLMFMARQFNLSGGSIRNIALASAFLAASDEDSISMKHLVLATRREYQKIGRLCTESDFAAYFDMVKG
ncbi:MAG TPA: ATP-binding protein [Dehalococcoidia bacterium]|nr:ATP-binding protein [Dehalococcoidia bacterium]